MKFRIFNLIIAVLLISSCTIQKRLYQPGWNINYRSSLKANLKHTDEISYETISSKTTDEKIVEEFLEKIIEQSDDSEADVKNLTIKDKEQPTKSKVHLNQLQENLVGELSQNNKITFFKLKPEKNDSKSIRTTSIVGLILFSVGAFLFVIGLLFYLSTNASILYSAISIIMGVICMSAGGLLILIALLILLITAVMKNEQRIKEESSVPENVPSNQEIVSPELNKEIPLEAEPVSTKNESVKSTKTVIILGGVAFILAAIFLLIKA